ncbi:signal recognition particle-docking protein FtsY [Halomicrobium salinisoli]|uniref:signal recognition particle-docking protein FtsY n=1 Tax=Halomicrobium salinisoli TaxID=2878391 RepID=UPI001CEFCF88|nr:signal recognition particle-docking protein FtsY [Halomicrobium salinisoli]
MFDGLKDKLGSFTSDVEEDVDEEAAEAAEEAAEEEPTDEEAAAEATESEAAEVEADAGGAAEPEAEPAPGAEPEPDAATEPDVEDDAASDAEAKPDEAGADAEDAASDADAEDAASDADAEDAASDADAEDAASEADADEEDEDGGGRGVLGRAKVLATGKSVIDEDDLDDHLDDLEMALLSSDVEMGVAQEILDGVKENLVGETRRRLESTGNLVQDALREALYDVISVGQFDFEERIAEADKPVTIVFTGVNGVGKTTTIAKLSERLENHGISTVLANGDTYRAGANEQLQKHADNLDRTLISHEQGSDPAAVLYDAVEYAEANDVDVVLGDTAGRLHTSDDLMAQLEKIDRVIDPDMTIFVDESVAGQDAVNRAREFDDAAEVDGAVLTKADADPQGGAAISIAHVTGKPILFLGTGQDYDDLEPFDPEEVVDRLLPEE